MRIFWILFLIYQSLGFAAPLETDACINTWRAGVHGVVRDIKGKIIRRMPLGRNPVIIDTNIAIAIVGEKMSPGKTPVWTKNAAKIHKMLKNSGQKPEDAHVYIADMTVKERFANPNNKNAANLFPEGTRIFEIEVPRSSPEYQSVLKKLESMNVGAVKANSPNDQEIVADLFFARKNYENEIPRFVTGDGGIFEPLCRLNPICANAKGSKKFIRESFPSGFDVTIEVRGQMRTVRIIPF